jgi:hypothetical protein
MGNPTNEPAFGLQKMSYAFAAATKLTAAGKTAKLHAYQIAAHARRVHGLENKSFNESYALAQEIDPSAILDYIPMADRGELTWWMHMKNKEWMLHHPRRGDLVWVGMVEEMPRTDEQRKKNKLFICRGCVATDVRTVVVESKKREAAELGIKWNVGEGMVIGWELVNDWMEKAREEWKTLVPESYAGVIKDCDMNEVWDLMINRQMTKDQFMEWLDQRAWDNANAATKEDPKEMVVEEYGPEDRAEVAREWARFERRQKRGVSFLDMKPLTEDSDSEEEDGEWPAIRADIQAEVAKGLEAGAGPSK